MNNQGRQTTSHNGQNSEAITVLSKLIVQTAEQVFDRKAQQLSGSKANSGAASSHTDVLVGSEPLSNDEIAAALASGGIDEVLTGMIALSVDEIISAVIEDSAS